MNRVMTMAHESYRILVTRSRECIPLQAVQMLEKQFQDVEYWTKPDPIPRSELLDRVKDKHGLFCLLTDRIDKQILEAAPSLKVVATMSVGCDHLDIQEIKGRGVRIGYTPDVLTDATADLTVALLLATSRRLIEGNTALKTGGWSSWSPLWMCGPALRGSTVGIVGLGRIGQAVHSRLRPFGVGRFLYCGRAPRSPDQEAGAQFVDREVLLRTADFVLVTSAFTEDMRGMFNRSAFQALKKTAIFINISRGGIVNQDDLVEALATNQIFAAGLDVMEPEPLPTDHPLTKLPNCVLLPHLGSAELETRTLMATMTAQNIIAAIHGGKMPAEC